MTLAQAAQNFALYPAIIIVVAGAIALAIAPYSTVDEMAKGRRFRKSRPAVRAFTKAKLAAPGAKITSEDVENFDLGVDDVAPSMAVTFARATRKATASVFGHITWVAAATMLIALAVAGIASATQDNDRHNRWVARLSAQITKTYNLPGKVNLADWTHLGPKAYTDASGNQEFLSMGNGNQACPASAGWCFNGAVLLRDGTVQPASLAIVGGKPILTDVNGVEFPHAKH